MVEVERYNLSGSTDGKPIKLTATSSPGDLIHTATASDMPGAGGVWDEIHVFLTVPTLSGKKTSVQFEIGGVAVPDDNCLVNPPSASGLRRVMPGLILQNGAQIRAYYTTAGSVLSQGDPPVVVGFINRITN